MESLREENHRSTSKKILASLNTPESKSEGEKNVREQIDGGSSE